MNQLTLGDILRFIAEMQKAGMSTKEIAALPVYLGDDDELNGIHTAWYCEKLDSENKNEDMNYLVDMINEDNHNKKLNGKGVLIS